ncbi:LARP4 [Candida pseudojiufengensis]|uniref:LARP4 n=1 Tax=Candida pseudojiufengensis TaxID=497109 RepID=UPI002225A427|nr:LARP4 [Candida pseudojiufengensis]KAI5961585.1 LARP4 [Candida pseudojiufengensis]
MSGLKRLTPAPPPQINAWELNTLIEDQKELNREHNSRDANQNYAANNEISNNYNDYQQNSIPILTTSNSSSYIQDQNDSNGSITLVTTPPTTSSQNHSQSKSQPNENKNKKDMLISVGKNLKIKKPIFPKSNEMMKNDTATEFNHLINKKLFHHMNHHQNNKSHHIWFNTPPITTPQPFTPFINDYNFKKDSSTSLPQPIPFATSPLPSPFLIPSSTNISPFSPQSPPIFQQHMIYCNLPNFQQIPLTPIPQNIINKQNMNQVSEQQQKQKQITTKQQKLAIKKSTIKKQIEYYFSTENLCKDTYLRSLIDLKDGKIEISNLLKFKRLLILSSNGKYNNLIIEVINEIENLELVDDNQFVRLKNWKLWVLKH